VRARAVARLLAHDETQGFVQEAVVDVLTYGPRFEIEDEAHFRAVLGRIVENNLRDKARWLGRERRDGKRVKPLPTDSVLRFDPPARSVTRPSEATVRHGRQEWVRLAIELLDLPDRDVIWMHDRDGLTFDQIGEQLDTTANAARMRYRHALPGLARKVRDLRQGRLSDALPPE
jgi:RNA polymerase sigma factor (sigma-70 family)